MINYLTHPQFASYDLRLPPSMQGGGGGMSAKTARVVEALSEVYPNPKVVTNSWEIDADTLLIEPLRFWLSVTEGYEDADTLLDNLKEYDGRKILYCSEMTLLRFQPELRNRLLKLCDVVTANCKFQARLFWYVNVHPRILCDPIPLSFYKDSTYYLDRKETIVASGNISWTKNVHGLIEVFKGLKGHVERVYIGSAKLWSTGTQDQSAHRLEDALYDVCDRVIEDATQQEVIEAFTSARFGVWVAYHDVFATAVHEMLLSGLNVVTAKHGLARELPVSVGSGTADLINSVMALSVSSPEELQAKSDENAQWATKRVAYPAFLGQLKSILGGLA